MINNENIYKKHWVESDSPLAAQAFLCGVESAIEELAVHMADRPSAYEDAMSEDCWMAEFAKVINKLDSQP